MTSGPAPSPAVVLDHVAPGTNVIVPLANGEPVTLLDALQQHAGGLDHVTVRFVVQSIEVSVSKPNDRRPASS